MDAKLLHAVRVRLEATPTEELLRLWTENDRERYSQEAFEAARLILTSRGVAAPPQREWTGRVPVAEKARSFDPSSEAFWYSWLRPLLWSGIAVGGVRCLYLVILAAEMIRTDTPYAWPSVYSFSSLVEAAQSVLNFALPPALLAGSLLSLSLKPIGRWTLLIWGWTELSSCALAVVQYGAAAAFTADTPLNWAAWTIYEAQGYVAFAAFALILLFFITRPQIKRLFDEPVWGFDMGSTRPADQARGEAALTAAGPSDQPPRSHTQQ